MEIRNVEIKLAITDAGAGRASIQSVADGPPSILHQADTYFDTGGSSLLKLRRESVDGGAWRASLISYQRTLADAPEPSDIRLVQVEDGDGLVDLLSHALPVLAIVRKTRELYFSGQTRIHLDDVERLGPFVELEVVLVENQSEADGRRVADRLLERLALCDAKPQRASYRDLLGAHARAAPA